MLKSPITSNFKAPLRLAIWQTRHTTALPKTSSIVVFRECSRLCKVLEVAIKLQKSKGKSKEAESISPSFFFFFFFRMHAPVHDRMPTPVGTHLIRAAALVCHVGRAFILFVSTFSKKFPSVIGVLVRDKVSLPDARVCAKT